LKIYFFHWIIW